MPDLLLLTLSRRFMFPSTSLPAFGIDEGFVNRYYRAMCLHGPVNLWLVFVPFTVILDVQTVPIYLAVLNSRKYFKVYHFRDMSSVSLQNLLSTTGTDDSDDRSMQDELLTTSRTITMCHFIVFNFCVGFFGYYIWLIFPRPRSNEATESERKSTDEIR
ncbi:hypothetical protein RB195_017554 [Necator americanus]|uniref:7TM GPCR serpentine receptor class x (Srx) domain-containing protein n=1 Tax=Necator americanus TaxID=51031 RepID=A0ABR1C841_NECAM